MYATLLLARSVLIRLLARFVIELYVITAAQPIIVIFAMMCVVSTALLISFVQNEAVTKVIAVNAWQRKMIGL